MSFAVNVMLIIVVLLGVNQIALAIGCCIELQKAKRRSKQRGQLLRTPSVVLICPCKGLDATFEANAHAMLELDYSYYTVIFVVADRNDMAWQPLEQLQERYSHARLIVAGVAQSRGDKVNNLLAAVKTEEALSADIIAFIDSDVNPHRAWLRSLISPLIEPEVGLTTGYRWYTAAAGQFWSWMRAVGNNVAMAPYILMGNNLGVAWGGAMAVRRGDFDRSGVVEVWSTAVDDDLTLGLAVKRLGLSIEFVPACVTTTLEGCTMRQYYTWLKRQLFLVKVYNPYLWRLTFLSFVPMVCTFLGIVLGLSSIWVPSLLPWAFILLLVVPLQIAGGLLTALAFQDVRTALWVPVGFFFSGALSVAAVVAAAFTQRITWHGITYEVPSADQVTIVARPTTPDKSLVSGIRTSRWRPRLWDFGGRNVGAISGGLRKERKMSGFRDAQEAKAIMSEVFRQIDVHAVLSLDMVYSYRFTDINWSCTVVLKGGRLQFVEGILPESETTIETTSDVFDQVMTGRMNVVYSHLVNRARILGSMGNVFKLRTVVPLVSEAYRRIISQRTPAPESGLGPEFE